LSTSTHGTKRTPEKTHIPNDVSDAYFEFAANVITIAYIGNFNNVINGNQIRAPITPGKKNFRTENIKLQRLNRLRQAPMPYPHATSWFPQDAAISTNSEPRKNAA